MGDNTKPLIGLGIVVVLALVAYLAFGDNGAWAAALVAVVGIVAVYLYQRSLTSREADEDDFYQTEDEAEAPAAPSSEGGLPTWSPEPLATWTPPAEAEEDRDTDTGYVSFDEGYGEEELDTSALDEFAGFDDLDTLTEAEEHTSLTEIDTGTDYEVEPEPEVEAAPARTSLFSAPAPIREDVHSDDDILEASHATELHLADGDGGSSDSGGGAGGNAELAKLLAKVQSRLAAYE